MYMRKSKTLVLGLLVVLYIYMACSGDRQHTNPLDPERSGGETGFGLTAVGIEAAIELSWSNTSFPKFERYVVYRGLAANGEEFKQIATVTANAYTDSGLIEIVEYEYRVTVIVNGDESQPSKVIKAVPLDGLPPTATILTPSEGQVISSQYEIVVEAFDNVGVVSVKFLINGEVVATQRESPYSYVWDVSDLENQSTHIIQVVVRDAAGNESDVAQVTGVVVDNAKPKLTTLQLSDPSPVQAGTVDFDIEFDKAMDRTQPLSISAGIDSPYDRVQITGTWLSDTQWRGTANLSVSTGDGVYTVRIGAGISTSGALMDVDQSQTFLLDTQAPQAGSVLINDGAVSTSSNEVALTLSAVDIGTGVDLMLIANEPSFAGAEWRSFEPDPRWSLDPGTGARVVYVRFRDGAGNETRSQTSEIVVDMQAPTIGFETPEANEIGRAHV